MQTRVGSMSGTVRNPYFRPVDTPRRPRYADALELSKFMPTRRTLHRFKRPNGPLWRRLSLCANRFVATIATTDAPCQEARSRPSVRQFTASTAPGFLIWFLACAFGFAGCTGSIGSPPSPPPTPPDTATISVIVSPASATIQTGGTQQFAATVTGTSNTSVTWSASGGTISTSGLFTAGATAGSFTISATSTANTAKI